MSSGDVRGVLLAGGDATRFDDGDKALALVDGTPMIRRVADALREATERDPVVAAGGDPPAAYRNVLDTVQFVDDDPHFRGPLAGLAGAAHALDDDWLLVAACDMPRLDARTLRWLTDERHDDTDAVVPTDENDVPQPLCACYRRTPLLDALSGRPPNGGPRALLDHLRVRTRTPRETPRDVDLSRALANVNTTTALDDLHPTHDDPKANPDDSKESDSSANGPDY